jgi:hypothetical protein
VANARGAGVEKLFEPHLCRSSHPVASFSEQNPLFSAANLVARSAEFKGKRRPS